MSSFAVYFAQAVNATNAAPVNPVDAAAAAPDRPLWSMFLMYGLLLVMVYFAFFRPQMQANKKKEENIKTAKTGDKIVTSSGIHGVITNVKETTVIVRVAESVKLEIEKSHIEKISRSEPAPDSDKAVTAKAS